MVTQGSEGPHMVATWGDYVRALGVRGGNRIAMPAGGYLQTEKNLKANPRVEIMIASRQVDGPLGKGRGFKLRGTAAFEATGAFNDKLKELFPWARGVIVIEIDDVIG